MAADDESEEPLDLGYAGVRGLRSTTREDLKRIVQYRTGIVLYLALHVLIVAGEVIFDVGDALLIYRLFLVPIGLYALLRILQLGLILFSVGEGIAYFVLVMIPCVGLIAVTHINSQSVRVLQINGIEVGLFGVDKRQLERRTR
jgi:hypothetical protein